MKIIQLLISFILGGLLTGILLLIKIKKIINKNHLELKDYAYKNVLKKARLYNHIRAKRNNAIIKRIGYEEKLVDCNKESQKQYQLNVLLAKEEEKLLREIEDYMQRNDFI